MVYTGPTDMVEPVENVPQYADITSSLSSGAEPSAASSRAQARRERILDAAVERFGRFGFAKTTLDEVARDAGLSKPSLYHYFAGGKEALFHAALEREEGRMDRDTQEALAGVVGGVARLEAFWRVGVARHIESMRRHRLTPATLQELWPLAQAHFAERMQDEEALVAELIGLGQAEGDVRDGDPARLAATLQACLRGYLMDRGVDLVPEDAELVVALLIGGLRP